jgi:predicted nucleic acid-binding protein
VKILLDTNVVLDHILSREPYNKSAEKIFDMISREKIEAAVTANCITDIYFIVSKRLGDALARVALRNLLNILIVISVDGNDCVSALNLPMSDFEDAVVVVCAKKVDIDFIISNDKIFSQMDSALAQVVSSDDFLSSILK